MELTFQQTNRFALNSSPSKHQFLFPKARRFQQKNNKDSKAKFYTLPSTITYQRQKAPSFPKLIKKMEFPNEKFKRIIPSPSTYSIKSDIQKSVSQKKGISIPKEKLKIKSLLQTPGPTAYNPKREPYLTARYSIGNSKKKLEFPLELQKGYSSPGPAYLVNVDKLQKVVSKFVQHKCLKVYAKDNLNRVQSSEALASRNKSLLLQSRKNRSISIIKPLSNREKQNKAYSVSNLLHESHKIAFISPIKNTQSIMGKFNTAEKKTIFQTKNQTPGPGYNWFSQFSKLEKKVLNQKIKAQNKKVKINKVNNPQVSRTKRSNMT